MKQVEDDAVIKTLCMDDAAFDLLHQMNFPHVDLVHVRELETPELLEKKRGTGCIGILLDLKADLD
ncbi:hypothetical protein BsIDN1_13440 [Bacillus safensis]|uniref:Uncharacterized protein n=1 Tax=Bacillus safensis TaxID=561879 RepID=A0A5S9M852_BACIA|nr:hypothetical protein BsIDN1_13440 [Bacillus safensis]